MHVPKRPRKVILDSYCEALTPLLNPELIGKGVPPGPEGQTLLHDDSLRAAAQPAVKGLMARCLSVILQFEDVMDLLDDDDAKSLVESFNGLQKGGFHESDIVRLYEHKLFDDYCEIYLNELKFEGATHIVSPYVAI
ncbi:hypothetical protein AJ78_08178 [Emergomyces pasteurianus Ep9510]|uniref:Uncharacterized protein n=1 Tax=Emergomyces pasteurianus Ep9510 TaxID=1447872 RepID=A0A1J9PSW6_9EURO|nr:hypothetical protein AJ78_08178 [Emergomyces pasteurianus Ep9510]